MPEKFKINITPKAQNDLEEIWFYIAKDNISQAESFVRILQEKINSLEVFPELCPKINHPALLKKPYRQMIYENYRILFRIEKNQIYILRVIHAARLLEYLF